ncbi:MAG TPA: helix-turn-helix transcriptional regulator [Polyangia bacterium]|jgi:DNA-binding CsgD family transcriptional regulator|nr:helix-turn-helix transcriptional regulator [Polyangia bacterium]
MDGRRRFERLLEDQIRQAGLSHREAEVMRAGLRGLDTKATAAELGCSPKTIDELWRRIYRKIDCRSRLETVALFLSHLLDSGLTASNARNVSESADD